MNSETRTRSGKSAARWLSDEIFARARELGIMPSEAAELEKVTFRLAEITTENRGTHLKIQEPAVADFLKNATQHTLLSCLTGTPKTFSDGKITPLIFDENLSALYFLRHYRQEVQTAETLIRLAEQGAPGEISARIEAIISAEKPFPLNEAQRRAVRAIISRDLTVISGGPGTGKTTLLLRALICIFSEKPDAKIILAAPTGKAAGRMKESVREQAEALLRDPETAQTFPPDALKKAADLEPSTLHRVLKINAATLVLPQTPTTIPADYVIIDESSMTDQALMHRLTLALRPQTKLVLLGDKNQLDSVGAGRVFGAICVAKSLRTARIELTESRRFDERGFLGKFARGIVSGNVPAVENLISESASTVKPNDVFRFYGEVMTPEQTDALLTDVFPEKLRHVPEIADPEEMLALIDSARILTPLRHGIFGVENLNARARRIFAPAGSSQQTHFHGQPVIITKNAPSEKLFNGDVGIILRETQSGTLVAYFRGENNGLRHLPATLLPEHETAYVMSIHQSQGSEFSRLGIVFPEEGKLTEFFSRQLLYTAVTRFRERGPGTKFRLLFHRGTLLNAVARDNPVRELLFFH